MALHLGSIAPDFEQDSSVGRIFFFHRWLDDKWGVQLTEYHSVATPVDGKDGQDVVIVPALKAPAVLQEKFPKGWTEVRPYLPRLGV